MFILHSLLQLFQITAAHEQLFLRNLARDRWFRKSIENGFGNWFFLQQKIAETGPKGMYDGEVAKSIVDVINSNKGVMSLGDLASYKCKHTRGQKTTELGGSSSNCSSIKYPHLTN